MRNAVPRLLLAGCCAFPALALSQQLSAQPSSTPETEDIVVTGRAVPGAVIGDIPPENRLNPADIAAYGVGTVTELLDEIAAQTQSDQGRSDDGPVVLVNGKRVSGVNEVGDLPTEAILRVDILPEEVALKYGYDAQRKVVNILLHRRFRSRVANLAGGFATEGRGRNLSGDMTWTRIRDNNRTNVALRVEDAASLLESDRAVTSDSDGPGDPTGTIGDARRYRTLKPASRSYGANATLARQIGDKINLSVNARASHATSAALSGLPSATLAVPATSPFADGDAASINRILSADSLRQNTTTTSVGAGLTLNADLSKRWRLSVIADYAHGDTRTGTDRGYDTTALQAALDAGRADVDPYGVLSASLLGAMQRDRATALSDTGSASVLVNGKLFRLPAGDIGVSLRVGGDVSSLRSRSTTSGGLSAMMANRSSGSAQASLDLPLASRRYGFLGVLGKLSANLNASVRQLSDYGTLGTFGYGLTWVPRDGISVIAAVNEDRSAPTLAQRDGPLVTAENVGVYDQARGETVFVTRLSGGNPDLRADDRHVLKLGLTLKPVTKLNLTFSANYIDSRTRNGIISPSGATVVLNDAFPSRFVRDAEGTLVSIDARSLNIAREDREQVRWGVNFTTVLRAPKRPPPPPGFRPPWARRGEGAGMTSPRPDGEAPDEVSRYGDHVAPGNDGDGDIVVRGERPDDPSAPPGPSGGFGGFDGGPPGPPPDGFGPPPGGGPGGFGPPPGGPPPGGFGGDNGAQLQFSLYHSWIFRDVVQLREGGPRIDLLDGGSIGGSTQARHSVQVSTGMTDNGLGVRLAGNWKSASRIAGDGASAAGDLRFAPLLTLDLRLYANLANRFSGKAWTRGTRVSLTIANLLNRRQRVTDAAGATPLAYQPAYLDPVGRTILLTIRRFL